MANGDVIFSNGTIRTLDPALETAEAVLVRDGRIVAVGDRADVHKVAGNAREVDLGGSTLLPGFIESHSHFMMAGQAFAQVDVRGSVVGSIAELQAALRQRAQQTPAGEWVIGRGYDQTLLQENRHPTRWDLDEAVPDHPCVIHHISYHGIVANSAAMRLAEVPDDVEDVPGGEILRDERGVATGVFLEAPAMDLVTYAMGEATVDSLRTALTFSRDQYLAVGVTCVHDALVGTQTMVDAYAQAIGAGELPLSATLMIAPELYDGAMEGQSGDIGLGLGLPAGRLLAGPAKLFQDGAIQAYTASLTQPYFDEPDRYGVKIHDPEELVELVWKQHSAGRQLAIHGNGDSAIDDILDAYENALTKQPRHDHRHRIEHLQTGREDQIDRMARLGVVASVFANHLWYFGDRHISRFLGPERAYRLEPLAGLSARGIRWGLHSDCPVTDVNPLLGIWLAVNRRTSGGQDIGIAQRVSVERALRGFGVDAAYLTFQEQDMGTIAPGMRGDFVVLSGDPADEPEAIKDLTVQATIIAGEAVYEAPMAND